MFIGLALRKEPPRGILDPRAKPELNAAIQSLARAHFEVDEALAAWRRALTAADVASDEDGAPHAPAPKARREADTSYFYAGLAFGLVFAGPCAIVP